MDIGRKLTRQYGTPRKAGRSAGGRRALRAHKRRVRRFVAKLLAKEKCSCP